MMKYYLLRPSPNSEPARLSISVPVNHEVTIAQGLPVRNWDPLAVQAVLEDRHTRDMLLASFGFLVISSKFRELLEFSTAGACQFLPLHIKVPRGYGLPQPFFLLNVTNLVDGLDRDHSKYAVWTQTDIDNGGQPAWKLGRIKDLRVAKFDERRVRGELIFQQVGWEGVYVHENLKNRIDAAGLTGTAFYDAAIDPIGQIKAIWN